MRHIYYFEVTIVNKADYWIDIGLCDSNFPLKRYCVGQFAHSFGIGGNPENGYICMEGKWKRNDDAYKFGTEDVIGCGIELVRNGRCRQLFFTKNGKICVESFPLPMHTSNVELFPAVSLYKKSQEICANFGQDEFKYDLAQHPTTN